MLRTALTGAHLLRTGTMVIDLRELIDDYGFPEARGLIEAKRAGERTVLSAEVGERWVGAVQRAFAVLEDAHQRSSLPAEPDTAGELEEWLLAERRKRF